MSTTTLQSKPKLPSLLTLILVVVLGISLAKLMWLVVTPKTPLKSRVEESSSMESVQKEKINYGKLIANQHLFGEPKKVPVEVKKTPKKPAEPVVVVPKLNLKLHGIVAYKSRDGFALISSNNGIQKVYGKGDELEEGVKVSEIFPEKVIIDNHGNTEELALPINQASDLSRKNTMPSFGGGKPLTQRPPQKRPVNLNAAPDLGDFRQEVMADPRKLMNIARPSPAIVDGRFIGFRVQPGSMRKMFRKLGFRPNDIITEVNGIVLDDASKGAMILSELSQAAELSVKVKRGNQEIFIQHSF